MSVLLTGITPQPPHREILKTAIGSSQSVEWQYHESVLEVVTDLKETGWTIIGVEQTDQSDLLQGRKWSQEKLVFIFGNEVTGISEGLLPMLDYAIEIPQFGTKHSLNVSVCAGIVAWDAVQAFI